MKVQFVKSAVFPLGPAPSDEKRALALIELCGRTAYKSEDKITEDSAKAFVLMLKSHGHLSVLEHSNLVLKVGPEARTGSSGGPGAFSYESVLSNLKDRLGFHRIFPLEGGVGGYFISGNVRAWLETLEHLKGCAPALYGLYSPCLHHAFPNLFEDAAKSPVAACPQVSLVPESDQVAFLKQDENVDLPVFVFRFICDRGITHEIVRHRVFSFTQESTRYVNYKNKGMALILPEEIAEFYDESAGDFRENVPLVREWRQRGELIFDWYTDDLLRGHRPQIARDILPNLLKSEIFVSGRFSGWKHFIRLRESKHAHPRIFSLAREVRKYFEQIGLPCGEGE